jgi:hypothetical protein
VVVVVLEELAAMAHHPVATAVLVQLHQLLELP